MGTRKNCLGNIDCGYTLEPPRRGGSNEYPQSMFWSTNKKNRYTPAKPFFHIKVGFKGVFIAWTCFPDVMILIGRVFAYRVLIKVSLFY